MFADSDNPYSKETQTAFVNAFQKGWLTRQYFSRGKHDLVLPAWVLGILGPDGEGRHGISGVPFLKNSDLRSYYALGSPDSEEEPVIDHRGGIIPVPGSYTILFGTLINERTYYSSEIGDIEVKLHDDGFPIVTVYWNIDGDSMTYDAFADRDEQGNEGLSIEVVRGFANHPLFICLCPLDQDGITSIPSIEYNSKTQIVIPTDLPSISISEPPIRVVTLPIINGHAGRIVNKATSNSTKAECGAFAASWAAEFPVRSSPTFIITLDGNPPLDFPDSDKIEEKWENMMEKIPEISTSSDDADYFFKTSAIILRLLADINRCVITVGPSVQEEVWIPALVYQTIALDRLGFSEVVRPILDNIHSMIDTNGVVTKTKQYDSQGALCYAITHHFYNTNDIQWLGDKFSSLKRVADWVIRQRRRKDAENPVDSILKGLLPKGHSSYFDPLYWKTDFYYSHNFWAAGAISAVSDLAKALGRHGEVERFNAELDKYKLHLDDSITQITDKFNFLPAGPYQRDNAGMIFNIHAFYPLKLYLPGFQPIVNTLNWLWDNYVHNGGILIDQPWNAYGTYFSLLLAQGFRYTENHDDKVKEIIDFMLENATNRAGWAEGISPLSKKGAVGDSPNGYVAAEWVNLMLDLFVEEFRDDPPIMLKGMPIEWLRNGISANNIILHYHSKMSLNAKLDDDLFTFSWKYEGEKQENPRLSLPFPLKELPATITQISTYCIALPSHEGQISLRLNIE